MNSTLVFTVAGTPGPSNLMDPFPP